MYTRSQMRRINVQQGREPNEGLDVQTTCKDCLHIAACNDLASHSPDQQQKMGQIEFWGNAEERCKGFEKKEET